MNTEERIIEILERIAKVEEHLVSIEKRLSSPRPSWLTALVMSGLTALSAGLIVELAGR